MYRRKTRLLKCMNKQEVLAEHKAAWKTNGLVDLRYTELEQLSLSEHCVKYLVNVMENNHWTDLVCSEENTQMADTLEDSKRRFEQSRNS